MDTELLELTQALVRIDSRSNLSNIPVAERIEASGRSPEELATTVAVLSDLLSQGA
jgi:hypothetical protein